MQRDLSFDYMKGFLIFVVVLGHCPAFLMNEEGFDIYADYMFVFCHSFHMPLFVFISGYFFSKKKKSSLKELIPKQIKRLLYPQFAWNLICLALIIMQWDKFSYLLIGDSINATVKCIYHFFTNQWYLWCIFICSMIVVLTYKIRYPKLVLIVLSLLMIAFFDYLPGVIFHNQQVGKQLLFFIGGMFLYDIKNHEEIMKKTFVISLIGYVCCWAFYLCKNDNFGSLNIIPKVFWAIWGIGLFYNISKAAFKFKIFDKILIGWGSASLGIYIIHTVINRFLIQGNIGLKINTGYIYMDYILCVIYSIGLTCVCQFVTQQIRKKQFLRKYLLGEK